MFRTPYAFPAVRSPKATTRLSTARAMLRPKRLVRDVHARFAVSGDYRETGCRVADHAADLLDSAVMSFGLTSTFLLRSAAAALLTGRLTLGNG